MIIVMNPRAGEEAIRRISTRLEEMGYRIHRSTGENRTILGVIGQRREEVAQTLEALPEVEKVVYISRPFKLVGREFHPDDTVIRLGEVAIGGPKLAVMAGPCAVEGEEQLLESAWAVKSAGAQILRAGAFKPRT
ncbi:MAG TPA: 3-deoxy-7-phosphoheptulonate synthase, partial [Bacillota bacterium]|nr:3-deoxy-7-phosphoheptulonate synthase [Bacillota bacterium]